ncbi:MAG: hypothetical protein ACOC1F_00415 [Myxococcota bacterium]
MPTNACLRLRLSLALFALLVIGSQPTAQRSVTTGASVTPVRAAPPMAPAEARSQAAAPSTDKAKSLPLAIDEPLSKSR